MTNNIQTIPVVRATNACECQDCKCINCTCGVPVSQATCGKPSCGCGDNCTCVPSECKC
ncbi:hypothetical protein BYT27DRAFT_7185423 [Phlegmacium glaucopus]|nr:hypothetical protein BYT27DRAFT_7185423 [Phlegmacium glaucopus]